VKVSMKIVMLEVSSDFVIYYHG